MAISAENPISFQTVAELLYGTDLDITLTDNDLVFQTQRVGIEEYKFDVPVGKYELTLNFAELEGVASENLYYNLGDESENSEISNYESGI